MSYDLEALGDDRFQRLCQALVVREFPDVQCFPLGQSDGGRDITSGPVRTDRELVVFQVKFTSKARVIADPHKWLLAVLEDEKPKLKKLITAGATRYIAITNVAGTAAPSSGSIDRVDKVLSEALSIPALCWWRDDIERRLDTSWDLKWAYPDLLTGTDLVRYFIEQRLTEHQERRGHTIRAFLADQYDAEQEVRFRQVELQNDLFSLYVDVPVVPLDRSQARSEVSKLTRAFEGFRRHLAHVARQRTENRAATAPDGEPVVGAASLLLDRRFTHSARKLVLEGAPGQGKSTVTQYVCQIHRVRLLGNVATNPAIPAEHLETQLRLPFRIDLRDFATWLQQKNPFEQDGVVPASWHKSLESFLAAVVRHHSGGGDFSVSDLHAVLNLTPVLLVFDGLDEVADIATRQDVVEELQRGVSRLDAVASDLQVLITSRPAAFANSPGLPDDRFPVIHLTALPRPVIEAYAEKWLDARKLTGKVRSDVNRILRSKLGQPHLRDLAKNPMQLAILLSLIHSKGASLPDKRTALYDSYVDLFFGREAEKNEVVREYRELLLNIHQYLAFVLHRDSELGGSGSIAEDDLHNRLRAYLKQEGYDPTLAGTLFNSMVERVVALVARVQGTYEFEVQPLREYFAARFLSDTAPLSPSGDERRGTKPDRFDAVCRNFYWQNVTRFFAGCFGKGELLALAERIEQLTQSARYNQLTYPRLLAATLLSDWVFSQSPKSVQQLAGLIFDPTSIRYLLSTQTERRPHSALVLADNCGRRELVRRCIELCSYRPQRDVVRATAILLRPNSSTSELRHYWEDTVRSASSSDRPALLAISQELGLLGDWPHSTLRQTFGEALRSDLGVEALFRARRFDVLHSDSASSEATLEAILSGDLSAPRNGPLGFSDSLAILHSRALYTFTVHRPYEGSVMGGWRRYGWADPLQPDASLEPNNSTKNEASGFLDAVRELFVEDREWDRSIEPWDRFVERSRTTFGDHWAHFELAALAARSTESAELSPELFDTTQSLCIRASTAASIQRRFRWWRQQLATAKGPFDAAFWLILLIEFASSSVVLALLDEIGAVVTTLDDTLWKRVARTLRRSASRHFRKVACIEQLASDLHPRTVVVLGTCFKLDGRLALWRRYLREYTGSDAPVLGFCIRLGQNALRQHASDGLEVLSKAYRKSSYETGVIDIRPYTGLPDLEAAQIVARDPASYPLTLLARVDQVLREEVARTVKPIARVAEEDGWMTAT